ncbi:hypothetical protein FQN57_002942 [Myotisia sp. PD_48]|nr:hypothetical protein FQN57_002942 [Myotisia sp. PD_48]
MKLSRYLTFVSIFAAFDGVLSGESWDDGIFLQAESNSNNQQPYQGKLIQANGGRFWVGGPTNATCAHKECKKDFTVIEGHKMASLLVGLPSGQALYVGDDAALRYTTPSNPKIPAGAWSGELVFGYGFVGAPFVWGFEWYFCSTPENPDYLQVYGYVKHARIPGCNKQDCCKTGYITSSRYEGPKPPVKYYN